MAYVKRLERDDRDFRSLQPTQVICKFLVAESDGKKILQLNTYGSDDREVPGKLSQTLQFGEQSAKDLFDLLADEYGFRTGMR